MHRNFSQYFDYDEKWQILNHCQNIFLVGINNRKRQRQMNKIEEAKTIWKRQQMAERLGTKRYLKTQDRMRKISCPEKNEGERGAIHRRKPISTFETKKWGLESKQIEHASTEIRKGNPRFHDKSPQQTAMHLSFSLSPPSKKSSRLRSRPWGTFGTGKMEAGCLVALSSARNTPDMSLTDEEACASDHLLLEKREHRDSESHRAPSVSYSSHPSQCSLR